MESLLLDNNGWNYLNVFKQIINSKLGQSADAAEYSDCISAED